MAACCQNGAAVSVRVTAGDGSAGNGEDVKGKVF